jgi:threonylcarbamoyladenosine tRNA methylthiotransferase MtaB
VRIFLDQIGCRLNYSEIEMMAGRLREAGHITVNSPERAQVVIFNSCAVTAAAGSKSRRRVRQFSKLNPQVRIAVTGCWATLEPEQAAGLPNVAMVVDNEQKDLLHTLLEPWSAELDDPNDLARMLPNGNPFAHLQTSETAHSARQPADGRQARTRAFIKVQDGCNNRCTFCVVTVARGESRSRSIGSIVQEVQQLSDMGVKEAVLTGVHLGSFGRDLADGQLSDLRELTSAVLADTSIARLRLSSLEPWELADGFFDLWQQWPQRLCPHLHLPLQAGTDKQLRKMARRCTTQSYRQLVDEARAAVPDLIITTDLIVGFPGETESDFAEGMDFVEEMRFAHAHIFPFSARTGTAAARYGGHVTKEIKKERSLRLHALLARTGREERMRHLHTVRPVLWEGEGEQLTDEPGRVWTGLTDNYLRVRAVMPDDLDLNNRIVATKMTELNGETLSGSVTI